MLHSSGKNNRILILSYDVPPKGIWGVSDNISKIYNHLSKKYIIDIASKNQKLKSKFINISTAKMVDEALLINKFDKKETYKDFELLMAWNLNLVKKIKEFYVLKKTKPTLVHCHSWLMMLAGKKIAEDYNIPLIYTAHFLEKQYSNIKNTPTSEDFIDIVNLEKDFFGHCDAIITFGKIYKNFLLKNYNIKKEKIFIIPHGIEMKKRPSKKENVILFVGRLAEEKGIYEFLETAKMLKDVPWKFVIIGSGPLEKKLQEKYPSKKIVFKRRLSRNELYKEYSRSKIYCSLSHIETFGLTKIEAALSKNVIITTKGDEIEKIFPEKIVFSVPINNPEKVVKILSNLINSDKIIIDKSEKVHKYAKDIYNMKRMIEKTDDIYKMLVHKTR